MADELYTVGLAVKSDATELDKFSQSLRALTGTINDCQNRLLGLQSNFNNNTNAVRQSASAFSLLQNAFGPLGGQITAMIASMTAMVSVVAAVRKTWLEFTSAIKITGDLKDLGETFLSLAGNTQVAQQQLTGIMRFWRTTKIFDQTDLLNAATNMKLFGIATENVVPYLQRLATGAAAVNSTVTAMEAAMETMMRGRLMARTREMQVIINQIGLDIGDQTKVIQRLMDAVPSERIKMITRAVEELGTKGTASFGAIESKQAQYTGKIMALQQQWVMLKEQFAAPIVDALTPILDEMIGGMDDGTDAAGRWGKAVADAIKTADEWMQSVDWAGKIKDWTNELSEFKRGWDDVGKTMDTVAKTSTSFMENFINDLGKAVTGMREMASETPLASLMESASKLQLGVYYPLGQILERLTEIAKDWKINLTVGALPWPLNVAQGSYRFGQEAMERFAGAGGAGQIASGITTSESGGSTFGTPMRMPVGGDFGTRLMNQYYGSNAREGWLAPIDPNAVNTITEGTERTNQLDQALQDLGADARILTDYWEDYSKAMRYSNDAVSREFHVMEALEKAIHGLGNPMREIETLIKGLSPDRQNLARWQAWQETVNRAMHETELRMRSGMASIGESVQYGISRMSMEWGSFDEQVAKSVQGIGNALASGISAGLTDILMGTKDVKEGFREMALAVIRDIERIILQMLVQLAIQQLLKGFGYGGYGAPVAAAFGPQMEGLALQSGGRVGKGRGGGDRIHAMLEEGEVVLNKNAAQAFGYQELDALNRRFATGQTSERNGVLYAQGGYGAGPNPWANRGMRVQSMIVGRWHNEPWESANWHAGYQLGQFDVHSNVLPIGSQFEYNGTIYTVRGPSFHGSTKLSNTVEFMDPRASAWDDQNIVINPIGGASPTRFYTRDTVSRTRNLAYQPRGGGVPRGGIPAVSRDLGVPRGVGFSLQGTSQVPMIGAPSAISMPQDYSGAYSPAMQAWIAGLTQNQSWGMLPSSAYVPYNPTPFEGMYPSSTYNPVPSEVMYPTSITTPTFYNPPPSEVMYPTPITETFYNPPPNETMYPTSLGDFNPAPNEAMYPTPIEGGWGDAYSPWMQSWIGGLTQGTGGGAVTTTTTTMGRGRSFRRSVAQPNPFAGRPTITQGLLDAQRFAQAPRFVSFPQGNFYGGRAPFTFQGTTYIPTLGGNLGRFGGGPQLSYQPAYNPSLTNVQNLALGWSPQSNIPAPFYGGDSPMVNPNEDFAAGREAHFQRTGQAGFGGPGWFMSVINTRPNPQGVETMRNWLGSFNIQVWNPTGGAKGHGGFVSVPAWQVADVATFTKEHPTWMSPAFIHGTGHGVGAGYYKPWGIPEENWASPQWGASRPPVTYWKGGEEVKFGDPLWYDIRRGVDMEDLGITTKPAAGYDEWQRVHGPSKAFMAALPGIWSKQATQMRAMGLYGNRGGKRNYDTGGVADYPLMLQTGGRVKAGEVIFTPEQTARLAPAGGGGQVNNVSISILNQGGQISSEVRTSGDGGISADDARHISRLVIQVCRSTLARERRSGGMLYSPRA